ncbi:MAG TPA: hypothetical protein VH857_04560 [Actinomycetes bacterium]|nr:hypothetical protein [Actinomycetes bacterium]
MTDREVRQKVVCYVALREGREETGLESVRLEGKFGKTDYDMSPYRDEVQHRHVPSDAR